MLPPCAVPRRVARTSRLLPGMPPWRPAVRSGRPARTRWEFDHGTRTAAASACRLARRHRSTAWIGAASRSPGAARRFPARRLRSDRRDRSIGRRASKRWQHRSRERRPAVVAFGRCPAHPGARRRHERGGTRTRPRSHERRDHGATRKARTDRDALGPAAAWVTLHGVESVGRVIPWVGLQADGLGFSPTGRRILAVGRASARRFGLRPDGLPHPRCGSGFSPTVWASSPTGSAATRMKCVGLKADPQLLRRGSGFSPTVWASARRAAASSLWVGLQPDGLGFKPDGICGDEDEMRRPEARPTGESEGRPTRELEG